MISRAAKCLLAAGTALVLSSCSQDDGPPRIVVAVGAEVTLTLRSFACEDGPLTACLSEDPFELGSVEMSVPEAFELKESRLVGDVVQVTVRALREGFSTLIVNHKDFRGRETTDHVTLKAAEITEVVASVHCDGDMPDPGRYAMTPDTEISIELTPMWGSIPIASGDLDLVDDLAGFVKVEPGFDGLPRYRAPSAPGKYTWDLKGSRGLDFIVYDPADVDVRLTEENGRVRVGRVKDNIPVCHHEGAARATVEVTKGACMPYVDGYEIDGKLPVDVGSGELLLELSGKDTCEVTVSRDGGSTVSLSLPVDDLPVPPSAGQGKTLTANALSVGVLPEKRDACPTITNLGDGICQVVDGDGHIVLDAECLLNWSWVKEPYSIGLYTETPLTTEKIGQGLWIELRLGIEYTFALIPAGIYSPNALTVSTDPATGLDITDQGCIGHDRQVLVLRPDAPGKYTLHLDATNVYQPTTFALSAAAIDSWQLKTDAASVKTFAGGTESFWFIGSKTQYDVRYFDAAGAKLAGAGNVRLSSDTPGTSAAVADDWIDMGAAPGDLRLEPEAASGAHLFHVVDASAITGLAGMDAASVPVGGQQCLDAYPTEAGGARIHGPSPVRPRAKIAGTALVVAVQYHPEQSLCLRGYEPGTADISVTWGGQSGQATYTVK